MGYYSLIFDFLLNFKYFYEIGILSIIITDSLTVKNLDILDCFF